MASSVDLGGEVQTVRYNPFSLNATNEVQVFLGDSEISETNYSKEIPKYFLE